MCGIIGYLGNEECFCHILNGLTILQNRGYDSAGICTINENKILQHKYASTETINALEKLKTVGHNHTGSLGLGHTRWLTHGPKTDMNAHPHLDHNNKIALVHNGIIENYLEIKKYLIDEHKILFKSDTDSEVIVNLISVLYQQYNNIEQAIRETLQRLHGSWALGIIFEDEPNKLYCAANGCPLLVGLNDNFAMLASEQSAFSVEIEKYICLKDGDFQTLTRNEGKITFSGIDYVYKSRTDVKDILLTPYPYPHFTIREIKEQTQSSLRSINTGLQIQDEIKTTSNMEINEIKQVPEKIRLANLDLNIKKFIKANNIILVGCGTSFYAGLHGANFFKDISGFDTVQVFNAGEFTEKDIPKSGTTIFLLLSQSGETKDLYNSIEIAKKHDIKTIGVVNVQDSRIAREVDAVCYLNAGREKGVASTKAFTSQVIILSLIAIWFGQEKQIHADEIAKYIEDILKLSKNIYETIELTEKKCQKVAEFLIDKTSCFVLGKGWMESIAFEGSLKIKEISYIHAEGYSAVALKHGPFSLLEPKMPVIFVNPDDENFVRVNSAIEEVKSRETPTIIITDKYPVDKSDFMIEVPKNTTFKGILHTIPMQLIAYYLAVYKKNNPDLPRNLAKCITVD